MKKNYKSDNIEVVSFKEYLQLNKKSVVILAVIWFITWASIFPFWLFNCLGLTYHNVVFVEIIAFPVGIIIYGLSWRMHYSNIKINIDEYKRYTREKQTEMANKYPDDYAESFRLVCEKENTLTVQKTHYKHYDLYYLKNGRLFNIVDEIYEKENKEVDCVYGSTNHAIRPDCYFEIANILGLQIDKESYIYLLCMWCDNNDYEEPIKIADYCLPNTFPDGWYNILQEADIIYQKEWK